MSVSISRSSSQRVSQFRFTGVETVISKLTFLIQFVMGAAGGASSRASPLHASRPPSVRRPVLRAQRAPSPWFSISGIFVLSCAVNPNPNPNPKEACKQRANSGSHTERRRANSHFYFPGGKQNHYYLLSDWIYSQQQHCCRVDATGQAENTIFQKNQPSKHLVVCV